MSESSTIEISVVMDKKMNNYSGEFLNKLVLVFMLVMALGLTGCGGGGGSDPAPAPAPTPDTTPTPTPAPDLTNISGGGIKGPLANAVVTIFSFDATRPGFKGAVVTTASTDASSAITGLNLPLPLKPPYIMEFSSVPGTTTDITTGALPVITTIRTVIAQALLTAGKDIYATPLTTLAVDIAVRNAADTNGTAGIQADEFEAALALAAIKVVSTFGFGLDRSVDIFDTPPLINSATISTAEQANVAGYRTAVEAITAIVYQISQQSAGATADTVLADLAADLADNDILDGSSGSSLTANTLQVLQQNPSSLPIPNTSPVQTVVDVQAILAAETAITGWTAATTKLTDGTIVTRMTPTKTSVDSDGDGVPNVDDDLPDNKDESVDSDGDGIGDNADPDDDNDGILDEDEGVPSTPTVNDSDGDTIDNGVDNCPDNFNPAQTNSDADTDGDACDLDADADGVNDVDDAFPVDGTRSKDTDGDGKDDDIDDTDDDNDGVVDSEDTGTSSDGTSCSLLVDCDGDGVLDGVDADRSDPDVGIKFVPVANDDSALVNEGQSVNINVALNDTVAGNTVVTAVVGGSGVSAGDALDFASIVVASPPSNGVLAVNTDGTVDYTHDGSETISDGFSYTVSDTSGLVSNVANVNITVIPVNDAPVANADSVSVNEGQSVNIDLAANDTDVDDAIDLSRIVITSAPANGSLVVNANGTVDYTHDGSETVVDSFSYTIRDDSAALSNVAAVNLSIAPQNNAPVANGDNASVNEGQSINLNLALNDTDVDSVLDLSSIVISSSAANGSLLVNANGTVDYVHDGTEMLSDNFSYTIRDTSGALSNVAIVSITVIPVNDAPVANVDNGSVNEGQSVNINLAVNDTDVDNALDLSSIVIGSAPTNGSLTVNVNGTVDYLHDGSETLTDSFSYTIRDASGAMSNTAVVGISVNAVNDVPVAIADSGNVNEGQSVNINLGANDTDADDAIDLSSIVITVSPSNGSIVINANGSVDYTHDGSETLNDNFSYTIRDVSGALSQVAIVSLTVISVNDAPVANADSGSLNEGQVINLNLAANDTDIDNALNLTSIVIVLAPSNGSLVVNANGTVDYTHDGSETLVDNFSYSIRDVSGALSQAAAVSLTIVSVNDAPLANADSANVNEGQSVNVNVALNDSDADNALDLSSIVIALAPSNGSLVVNANGTVDYTHNGSEMLSDGFSYTIRDASGAISNVAVVSLTVNPQNDAPIANTDNANVNEGQSLNINLAANDTDADNAVDLSSINIVAAPANGSLVVNANGTVDYTHNGSETIADSFSYTISDVSAAVSNTATVNLTISPQNDAPIANADSSSVNEGQSVNINLAANDIDAENVLDLNSIVIIASPANGVLVVNTNGTVDYTHDGSETIADGFTYTIRDATATVSQAAAVTLNIVPVNDLPVGNPDSFTVDATTATILDVLANDTDVDGALTISNVSQGSLGSTVTHNGSTVTFTDINNATGSETFTYDVTDGTAIVTGINVTVTIIANIPNTPPVANDDNVTTTLDTTFFFNVLANDTDIDGDVLSVSQPTSITTLTNGSLVNNGGGTFTYTPNPGFIGTDSFTYTVTDSIASAAGTVTITVTPPGTPIDIITLMSAAEGGVAGIENAETNVYAYWTDNYDPVSAVFSPEDKVYNHLSGVFDTVVNNGNLLLSGTQWVSEGGIIGTDDGNGGLDLTILDANNVNVEVARFKLTAHYQDLSFLPIIDHLNTVWQGAMVNTNATFNVGAKLITDYRFETLVESHVLGQDSLCQRDGTTKFADLNGNCNSVDVVINATGYAQLLNDVVAATAWVDPGDFSTPPGAVTIATNNVTNKTLMVQLVSGNAANYYVVDWSSTSAFAFVANAVAGPDWVQNTDSGVDMIHFQVPASFITQFSDDLSAGLNYFLTVQNGFVRQGLKHAIGDAEFSDSQFNGNALDNILANFSASVIPGLAELTGTWLSSVVSANADPALIHIFANANYESSGSCDLDGSTGMEYGTVSISANGSTTDIIAIAQVATQGLCGPAQGNKTLAVNGDVLTLSEPGFADIVYNRLLGTLNPIVGSWLFGNIQDPGEAHTVLTMLDDTTFTLSQDCTTELVSGFEYGTYVWDQGNTNNLTGTLTRDSNGGCGLHDNTALTISGFTVTVPGDTLTLADSVGGNFIFTRISPAYVIPMLQVVYTLDNLIMDQNNGQITGSFTWSYVEGDFAGGAGQFTDLFIPGYGTDFAALTITFNIEEAIQMSLAANTNNNGLDISLNLSQPLSLTLPSLIDTATSSYDIEINGRQVGLFVDGTITPQVTP